MVCVCFKGSCEEGWKLFKETACYYFSGKVATFLNAQFACEGMGANLASIHNIDEH